MFKFDIGLNELQCGYLPTTTFADRLKKAKLMAGYTQSTLSRKIGLSLSTVNELEAGYRDMLYRDTLLKLLTVLDKEILCDDYCNFILKQEDNIKTLISKYGIEQLSNLVGVHRTMIEHWRKGKFQVGRKHYNIFKNLF